MSEKEIIIEVSATLKEVIVDKSIPVELRYNENCSKCFGVGSYISTRNSQAVTCIGCNGKGVIQKNTEFLLQLIPGKMDSSGIDNDTYSYQVVNFIQGKTVLVKVNIEPNLLFTPDGKDLICNVPVYDYKPNVKRRLPFPTLENIFRVQEVFLGESGSYHAKGLGGYIHGDSERGDIIYNLVKREDAPVRLLDRWLWNIASNKEKASKTQSPNNTEESAISVDLEWIKEMLPIIDSLEKALDALTRTGDSSHKEGLQLILDMHRKVLANHGVHEIYPHGAKFNPHAHEAMSVDTTSEKPKNTVTEVIQRGYWLHNKLLRPARVRVSG